MPALFLSPCSAQHTDAMYSDSDAAIFFATEVLPLVRDSLSLEQSPFIVAGRKPPPQIRALEDPENGVAVQGFVQSCSLKRKGRASATVSLATPGSSVTDLGTLFSKARILVIPHQYSAGVLSGLRYRNVLLTG